MRFRLSVAIRASLSLFDCFAIIAPGDAQRTVLFVYGSDAVCCIARHQIQRKRYSNKLARHTSPSIRGKILAFIALNRARSCKNDERMRHYHDDNCVDDDDDTKYRVGCTMNANCTAIGAASALRFEVCVKLTCTTYERCIVEVRCASRPELQTVVAARVLDTFRPLPKRYDCLLRSNSSVRVRLPPPPIVPVASVSDARLLSSCVDDCAEFDSDSHLTAALDAADSRLLTTIGAIMLGGPLSILFGVLIAIYSYALCCSRATVETTMDTTTTTTTTAPRVSRGRDASSSTHVGTFIEALTTTLPDSAQEDRVCSVCLEDLEPNSCVVQLLCRHTFHVDCISRWVNDEAKNTCPDCKRVVLDDSEEKNVAVRSDARRQRRRRRRRRNQE
jgi:hypothetical protein